MLRRMTKNTTSKVSFNNKSPCSNSSAFETYKIKPKPRKFEKNVCLATKEGDGFFCYCVIGKMSFC